jgi:hypothetical protein
MLKQHPGLNFNTFQMAIMPEERDEWLFINIK